MPNPAGVSDRSAASEDFQIQVIGLSEGNPQAPHPQSRPPVISAALPGRDRADIVTARQNTLFDKMPKPLRNALIMLGIAIGVAVILTVSMRRSKGQAERELETPAKMEAPAGVVNPSGRKVGNPEGPKGESAPPLGKPRIRPSVEELARRRLERHRVEIVERIKQMREGGLSDRHPSLIAASEDLKKVEAEEAGAGQSATRSESQ